MVYYLDHAVYVCVQNPKKDVLRRNMMYWATRYKSAQNPIKDVLRRIMVGHVVHICAEPYKICTAQEHDVYYLGLMVHICAESHKRCTYCAGTWCTTWTRGIQYLRSTVQEHDVLPGPRGTYLRRTL